MNVAPVGTSNWPAPDNKKFFIVPACMSKVDPDSSTISTASKLASPYILGRSNVPASTFMIREPPLPIVNVGLFVESSLKISLLPSRIIEHPSIDMSPARTIVEPMNSYT